MSFIQSTRKCKECGHEINVAAGVVGNQVMGDGGPADCPVCHGALETISQGWNATNPTPPTEDMKDQYTCASCAKTVQGDKCPNCGIGKFTATVVPPTEDRDWKEKVVGLAYEIGGREPTALDEDLVEYVESLLATAEARGRKEMLEGLIRAVVEESYQGRITTKDGESWINVNKLTSRLKALSSENK